MRTDWNFNPGLMSLCFASKVNEPSLTLRAQRTELAETILLDKPKSFQLLQKWEPPIPPAGKKTVEPEGCLFDIRKDKQYATVGLNGASWHRKGS
jgi:hypothetical protein